MEFPRMQKTKTYRQTIAVFGGYDARPRIPAGSFSRMENITSDHYPLLRPRDKRGLYQRVTAPITGMVANQGVHYTQEQYMLLANGLEYDLGLSDGEKTLVSMGARVAVFPDKKWINIAACLSQDRTLAHWGTLEYDREHRSVMVYAALADGTKFPEGSVAIQKPTSPSDGQLWRDYTVFPAVLKRWFADSKLWVEETMAYARLECSNIGQDLKVGDAVQITGSLDGALEVPAYSRILWIAADLSAIVVEGFVIKDGANLGSAGPVRICRKLPAMDFVVAAGNRLWGCKFGITENGPVNEIYASKLGDMENWHSFQGISTDSYVVSLGEDGPFTGAVCYQGRPIFFKSGCMIEILGSYPEQFRTRVTQCDGVAPGCEKSLAVVGDVLYYKSVQGVCAYDGGTPVQIGRALGAAVYTDAVAAGCADKYYVSMCDQKDSQWGLFVYDSHRGLWHREDALQAVQMCSYEDQVYALTEEQLEIVTLRGSGDKSGIEWCVETGDLCMELADSKYITRLDLRMAMEKDSEVIVMLRYDAKGFWESVFGIDGNGSRRTITVPILPRRCDHLQLRIEGIGDVKVYSIGYIVEQGGDPQWT